MNKTITITDETLKDFADYFHHEFSSGPTTATRFEILFKEWIDEQKFSGSVGLSESQVESLAARFEVMHDFDPEEFIKQIEEWKLSQQFLEPIVKHISMSKKPDWRHAPKWANWLAKNMTGEWVWFEVKPERVNGEISTKWSVPANTKRIAAEDNSDWKKSLEGRPAVISNVYDASNERLKDDKKVIKIEVDWKRAPKDCDTYEVKGTFTNSKWASGGDPSLVGKTLYSETKPVEEPIVEIGQEWANLSYGSETVCIEEIIKLPGSTRLDCGWVDNAELVCFRPIGRTDNFISRMMVKDFVKDFARIK